MNTTSPLGDLLSTILERRPFARGDDDGRSIEALCHSLLSQKTEKSGLQVATAILDRYEQMDRDEKLGFFRFLNDEFDVDRDEIVRLAQAYAEDPTSKAYVDLSKGGEAKRLALFRRLNEPPGATTKLVRMRADMLGFLRSEPDLKRVDHDFVHLLTSWFNRGFLVLRQITWDSSATVLEKVIEYEAVHEIRNWDDLRRRLQPADRRCFAFFHPAMPDEPLIFVEIALVNGVPNSVQTLLADDREILSEDSADTAVFYSISNCQKGLAGISFGNSLIKQVARDLSRDLPNLKTFVTLSPIPGLVRWLEESEKADLATDDTSLKQLAAHYLLEEKSRNDLPRDPVARFHLSNGAQVYAVHAGADTSANGIAQSKGAMVNYLYDLKRISKNLEGFAETGTVAATSTMKSLARKVQ